MGRSQTALQRGRLALALGRPTEAAELSRRAIDISSALADIRTAAQGYVVLGDALTVTSDEEAAAAAYGAAIERLRSLGADAEVEALTARLDDADGVGA